MYDIIIDNLTAEALQKFLKISGDATIKKSLSKEALIEQTKQKIAESPEFSSSFKSFFNEIEKAGRKDFWFRKLSKDLDLEEINILRNNLKKMKTEGSDIFIPTIDDKPEYFNVTKDANIIEVKVIRKKIIKVQDSSKNVTEGDYLYVAYNLTNVRHVSYYKLDLTKNNKLLFETTYILSFKHFI